MRTVFIIGSTGKVGLRLVKLLSAAGHTVTGLCRDKAKQSLLIEQSATPILADLTQLSALQLARFMQGSNTVIFTAGAGGAGIEHTNAVDGAGLELAVEAAKIANVNHFILVSVFPEAGRTRETTARFENYIAVKKKADAYLVNSELNWLIIRPGRLTDDPIKNRINAGQAIPYGSISRDDVAAMLTELVQHPQVHHKIIELTEGDTTITEAISIIDHY